MDFSLLGHLVLAAAFLPYLIEVFIQLRLQARFMVALPETVRATLPAHPRNPWLVCAGSVRFFLALWRCWRRDQPDDPLPVIRLKHQIRASLRREMVWGIVGVGAIIILVAAGWRPIWP